MSLWSTIQVSGCQAHGGPTNVPWNARVPPSFRVEQTPEWAIGDRMGEKARSQSCSFQFAVVYHNIGFCSHNKNGKPSTDGGTRKRRNALRSSSGRRASGERGRTSITQESSFFERPNERAICDSEPSPSGKGLYSSFSSHFSRKPSTSLCFFSLLLFPL